MPDLLFRARLRHARCALGMDFAAALYAYTDVGGGRYDIDFEVLKDVEHELYSLAGGPAFETWWQGLSTHEQMLFARGELPPWRDGKNQS